MKNILQQMEVIPRLPDLLINSHIPTARAFQARPLGAARAGAGGAGGAASLKGEKHLAALVPKVLVLVEGISPESKPPIGRKLIVGSIGKE